jgi:predicted membrane chloride channel (bestrophin family)
LQIDSTPSILTTLRKHVNSQTSQQAELPFWRILLFYSGTCIKEITTDGLVWLTMAIYIGLRIFANVIEHVPTTVELWTGANIGVLGGFLSFFLVLFVNQTNGRFLEMYGFNKACSGRIQDVAGLAKTQLPPEMADRLVRHFNAAQIAGYVGLNAIGAGSPYSKAYFFDHYNNLYKLLNEQEMRMLDHHDMDNSGLCMKELVTWCQQDVGEARAAGHIDMIQEQYYHDRILAFRAAMDGMYDYTDQPPHFFYIHFIVLLSSIYLPLFAIDAAYGAGWGDNVYVGLDVLNGIIVLLQCIFVVGLRSLGTKMIDPYGDDLEDLSVILYVESTLEICSTIMNSRNRFAKSGEGEGVEEKKTVSINETWNENGQEEKRGAQSWDAI